MSGPDIFPDKPSMNQCVNLIDHANDLQGTTFEMPRKRLDIWPVYKAEFNNAGKKNCLDGCYFEEIRQDVDLTRDILELIHVQGTSC